MFQRIIKNLSHPKYAFLYMKDKISRVIFYILLLTTIMSLPVIIVSIFNPSSLIPSKGEITNSIDGMVSYDVEIVNNKLNSSNNHYIDMGMFKIIVGNVSISDPGYILKFDDEAIITYLSAGNGIVIETNKVTYESLNINDLEFSRINIIKVTNLIMLGFSNDNAIITSLVLSGFLINLFDLVMIILILSLFASLLKVMPIKFGDHFKINTYITTIYAVISLILTLFNLMELSIIALIITYIYQNMAYRSIKIIRKVEVKNKDE